MRFQLFLPTRWLWPLVAQPWPFGNFLFSIGVDVLNLTCFNNVAAIQSQSCCRQAIMEKDIVAGGSFAMVSRGRHVDEVMFDHVGTWSS